MQIQGEHAFISWMLLKPGTNKFEVIRMKWLREILPSSPSKQDHQTMCEEQPTIVEEMPKQSLYWFAHVQDECQPATMQTTLEVVLPIAPWKTWTKQIENNRRDWRLFLKEATIVVLDHQASPVKVLSVIQCAHTSIEPS